ncbi:hypothetical protein JCM19000A_12090 [Silvimonas sp. JCM 19000]
MKTVNASALLETACSKVDSDAGLALKLARQARRACAPTALETLAESWEVEARARWALMHFRQGATAARRGLKLCDRLPDLRARVLWVLAECQRAQGRYGVALDTWMATLELSMLSRQPHLSALAYLGIGNYYQIIEEPQRAMALRRQAYDFACQSGQPRIIAQCAIALAGDYTRQRLIRQAQPLLHAAQDLVSAEANPTWLAEIHYYNGLIEAQNGNTARATRELHEALRMANGGAPWVEVQCLNELARLHRHARQFDEAVVCLHQAIAAAHAFDTGYLLQSLYLSLCAAEEARGHFAEALAAHEAYHDVRLRYLSSLDDPGSRPSHRRLAQLELRLEVIQARKETDRLLERHASNAQRLATQARQTLRSELALIDRGGLEQELGRLDGQTVTLLNVRLENLNAISERYSFATGDQMLADLGRALATFTLRHAWFAARYSTASFVLIVPGEQLDGVVKPLLQALEALIATMQTEPQPRIVLRACRVHDHRTAFRSVLKAPPLAHLPRTTFDAMDLLP